MVLFLERPVIKTNSSRKIAVSSKSQTFSVMLDGLILSSFNTLHTVNWFANGVLIFKNSKYNITNDFKLVIMQPNASDAGFYQVIYFFDGYEMKEAFSLFYINGMPFFLTNMNFSF